ncbi:hypothetical protein SPRG_11949 [Saprolegnia parasitica CBS 223.65]|uniref:Uncharacterized protein n=1 Tax=Saprolegnia parasitica (strain CBS 223.65) TaxID=695850 RepID=A0A067C1V3_SAPPC|nr:hypothetical protein SPRG_11949 [Saprolegnia parasitica CBS 223.65]KDO23105.1 hypothetical protein SPRG_11949 [Saprolegnia parasitica CBS 223.65]|eukprot:XP_012206216.1 hypothetical protein SPRG_11949 [Saprolegnia parasitica CBS 223.65]
MQANFGRSHRHMGNHLHQRSLPKMRSVLILLLPLACLCVVFYEVGYLQSYVATPSSRHDMPIYDEHFPLSKPVPAAADRRSDNGCAHDGCAHHGRAHHDAAAGSVAGTRGQDAQAGPRCHATADAVNGRTTMVLIANYRDTRRCAETLDSLFTNAVHPELVHVSIFDQIYLKDGEIRCIDAYCSKVGEAACRRSQMVNSTIDADDATGPTRARYETEKGITDEDFCLAIDSHLVFVKDWDAELLSQWDSLENDHAIITVYPKSTELLNNTEYANQLQLMCHARIESSDADTMIQYGAPIWIPQPPKPRLMSQLAGGFNFGNCVQAKTVRNDPYTPFLFHGEEYSRAARLWTSGYDFYVPKKDVVYHWYEERKVIWEKDWDKRYFVQQKAKRRIRHALGLSFTEDDFDHTEIDAFKLGSKRTFAQWIEFSGIDPNAAYVGKEDNQFDNCKELTYVSY